LGVKMSHGKRIHDARHDSVEDVVGPVHVDAPPNSQRNTRGHNKPSRWAQGGASELAPLPGRMEGDAAGPPRVPFGPARNCHAVKAVVARNCEPRGVVKPDDDTRNI
jgi:hypothetical protein